MNFVYEKDRLTPMTAQEIANAANAVCPFKPFTDQFFMGEDSKVQKLQCLCNGNGEFEIMPPRKGEIRLRVQCRLCGTETYV